MAIPVARVHLKVAHAALPGLLPTPPKWKMLPQLPAPCVAAIVPKPPLAKPSRAGSDERWDAHKTKAASTSSSRSASAGSIRSSHGGGPAFRKNATSPPPKPGRADAVERWDAHKKAAATPASSPVLDSMCLISHAASAEHWDVNKKRCLPQDELLNDGESSSTGTGSNDIDDMEEEILWKPRAMYAGPGFVVAAPQPTMLPMPTGFLVRVA